MDRATVILVCVAQIILSGCSFEQLYVGSVSGCDNEPVGNAEIEAWKNQWFPFHLPERLGTAYTQPDGSFELKTEKRASFLTYSGNQLTMQSHPKHSNSRCGGDAS
jgi:hypothetical protein